MEFQQLLGHIFNISEYFRVDKVVTSSFRLSFPLSFSLSVFLSFSFLYTDVGEKEKLSDSRRSSTVTTEGASEILHVLIKLNRVYVSVLRKREEGREGEWTGGGYILDLRKQNALNNDKIKASVFGRPCTGIIKLNMFVVL